MGDTRSASPTRRALVNRCATVTAMSDEGARPNRVPLIVVIAPVVAVIVIALLLYFSSR